MYKYIYKLHIKYIRYCIYNSKTIKDIINLIKNINFFYKNINSDEIINIIIDCFIQKPPSDIELQKFSLLQQQYDINSGLENYVTFIMWISIIQYIQENNIQENNIQENNIQENNIEENNIQENNI